MKISNFKIKTLLQALSLISLLLALAAGVIVVRGIEVLNEGANHLYDDILPGLQAAEEMNAALADMRIGGGEHLMATTDQERDHAEKDIANAYAAFSEWSVKYEKNIAPGAKEEKKHFDSVVVLVKQYEALNDNYVAFSRASRDAEASALFRGKMAVLYNQIGVAMDNLIHENNAIADAVDAENHATYASLHKVVIGIVLALITCSVISGLVALFLVIKPLAHIVDAMSVLAAGNTNTEVPFNDRTNEVGSMAKAVQVFKLNMIEANRLKAEQEAQKARTEAEKRAAMQTLADNFESGIQGIIGMVSSASTELFITAEGMKKIVASVSIESGNAASASQQTTGNVQSVASAVEEMSASIREIASQVSKSSMVVTNAVDKATHADQIVQALAAAVIEIGSISELIQNIAGQINLLALNATIESARAGEAGKGFAVVASEVKNLAMQTGKATQEISQQIDNIKHVSVEVATVLKDIQDAIRDVNSYSSGIASAVEEQSAATREISANMQQAAHGVDNISTNITKITHNATNADSGASEVLVAAKTLSEQSEKLNVEVRQFLDGVRG